MPRKEQIVSGPKITYRFKTPAELLNKARRERDRFHSAYTGWQYGWQTPGSDEDSVADHFWNFVVTAHHIADWANKAGRVDVHHFVDSREVLAVCRVLANGSKHFEIDPRRYDAGPAVVNAPTVSAGPTVTFFGPMKIGKIKIRSERGTVFEASDFADRVIAEWDAYFSVSQHTP